MAYFPELKCKQVQVCYWTCNYPWHRHKTERVAAACIKKFPIDPMLKDKIWGKHALAEILAAHRAGATYIELSKKYGIAKFKAIRLVYCALRAEKFPDLPFWGLSNRAISCLSQANISNKDELLVAYNSGKLAEIYNLGAGTLSEIGAWLTWTEPKRILKK